MASMIYFGLLAQLLAAGSQSRLADFVCIERHSPRVVFAYWLGTDRRCNLTAIQSSKGLAIIDTEMSPRVMAPIKARIEQVFGRNDWVYVINTHAHDNHAGGNSLFRGATIVGHENLAQDMQWLIDKQVQPDWKQRDLDRMALTVRNLRAFLPQVAGSRMNTRRVEGEIAFWELHSQDLQEGYEIVKPTLTFSDRQTLDLGDLQLELVFFGRGHSLSDTLVYIPQEKLLVSGAIAYQRGQLPEIGERTELEDVNRFLTVLDGFLAPEVQISRVVPSHSTPLLKNDLRPVRDYYHRMLDLGRQARREGLTLEQAISRLSVRSSFSNFRDPPPGHWAHGMQERNVRNLWRILDEEQRRADQMKPAKD
ncbi:MAG: MBL fold metallo-hydrolase [Phycisphaerae bacterium]|nr:MBL fold metallo-hydrolase [Phycisphaerae bacterium]